jgi:cytochrome c oxidase subunit 2
MDRKRLMGLLSAALVATLVTGARVGSATAAGEQVIHMTAKKFEYNPSEITVKKGQPVVIEIVSLDRKHGFTIPELNIRMDVKPGEKNVVRFTPDRAGTFNFHCDNFCGEGHEGMAGKLIVQE